MENVTDKWKSKDFYLSSIVRASGYQLLALEKNGANKFVVFVFDVSTKKAESIISDHWSRKHILPTKDVIDAINELRTRLKRNI